MWVWGGNPELSDPSSLFPATAKPACADPWPNPHHAAAPLDAAGHAGRHPAVCGPRGEHHAHHGGGPPLQPPSLVSVVGQIGDGKPSNSSPPPTATFRDADDDPLLMDVPHSAFEARPPASPRSRRRTKSGSNRSSPQRRASSSTGSSANSSPSKTSRTVPKGGLGEGAGKEQQF